MRVDKYKRMSMRCPKFRNCKLSPNTKYGHLQKLIKHRVRAASWTARWLPSAARPSDPKWRLKSTTGSPRTRPETSRAGQRVTLWQSFQIFYHFWYPSASNWGALGMQGIDFGSPRARFWMVRARFSEVLDVKNDA